MTTILIIAAVCCALASAIAFICNYVAARFDAELWEGEE